MRGIFAPIAPEHHAGSPMLLFRLQRFSGRIADFIGNRIDDIVLTMAYLADFLSL